MSELNEKLRIYEDIIENNEALSQLRKELDVKGNFRINNMKSFRRIALNRLNLIRTALQYNKSISLTITSSSALYYFDVPYVNNMKDKKMKRIYDTLLKKYFIDKRSGKTKYVLRKSFIYTFEEDSKLFLKLFGIEWEAKKLITDNYYTFEYRKSKKANIKGLVAHELLWQGDGWGGTTVIFSINIPERKFSY